MTRTQQEQLVEHYINGTMTAAEEEEFFMRVAVESDLRQTLKAYRIVDSAIRKHRDAAPIPNVVARARLLASLGVPQSGSEVPGSGAPAAASAAMAAAGTGGENVAARSSATGVSFGRMAWIVATVAVVAFCGGLLLNRIAKPDAERAQSALRPEALLTELASGSQRFNIQPAGAAAIQAVASYTEERPALAEAPRVRGRSTERIASSPSRSSRTRSAAGNMERRATGGRDDTMHAATAASDSRNDSNNTPTSYSVKNEKAKFHMKLDLPPKK